MTTKEKAKAYDEAIEQLRIMMPNLENLSYNGKTFLQELVSIFPELKGNEYESIRKRIISLVNAHGQGKFKESMLAWLEKLKVFAEHGAGLYYFGNSSFTYIGSPILDNDSWLEKQEPKKHVDDLTQQEAMDIAVAKCFKQSEQKHALDIEIPFGAKDSELQEATYLIPEGFHAEINDDEVLIKKGKQKSITSNNAHIIDSALNDYCCKQYDALHKENGGVLSFARLQHLAMDIYGWCKEQGKQNPAWTEADDEELEIATNALKGAGQYDSADWLKSIKQRIGG